MAKDRPGPEQQPDEAGNDGRAGAPDSGRTPSSDEAAYQSEREALNKAREGDASAFNAKEAPAGHGNLHFGDQVDSDAQSFGGGERGAPGAAPSALAPASVQDGRGKEGDRPSDAQTPQQHAPAGDAPSSLMTVGAGESPGGESSASANISLARLQAEGSTKTAPAPDGAAGPEAIEVKRSPVSKTPAGEAPPAGETPDGEDPDGDTPGDQGPDGETPDVETPGNETPVGELPDEEDPDVETPVDEEPVNTAPADILLSGDSVTENDEGAVVATLSAVDADSGDMATFAIVDDPSGLFDIDGDELKLKPGASADFESQVSYDLTLSVTDAGGNVYEKTVTINVADVNEAPADILLSGDSVAENADGAVVAMLSAVDADSGDTATFAIVDDPSSLFEIAGDELKLKPGAAADFEAQPSYDLTLSVTDAGGNVYETMVTINVADVNEAPADILLSGDSVAENADGAVVATLSAIDPDFADSVAFAIADDASGLFEISGDELRLKPGASADYEAQDAYEVTLEATDSAGNTFLKTVTINVADVNEAPGAISLSSTDVVENQPGAVVGTVWAFDPDAGDSVTFSVSDSRFEIVAGELRLKPDVSFDFETADPVDVTITATDASGLTSEQTFTINVADANEGPSLGLVSSAGLKASYYDIGHSLSDLDQIDFTAAPDAEGVVGSLDYMQGQQRFWDGGPADYFAAKYEGQLLVEGGGTYTFYMASDDGSMLYIDGVAVLDNDGLHGTQTRTVSVNLDAGAHDIEVRYFENGGSQTLQLAWAGPDTGGVREVIGGDAFEHGARADSLSVPDDAQGAIIAQLAVSDPDAGDAHSFTVSDERFEVVEDAGAYVLKLKDGVAIDYETETDVAVAVTVTDAGGATDTMNLVIAVDDVNAAPEIGLSGGEGLQASYYNVGHSLNNLSQIDFNAPPDAEGVVDSLNYMQNQNLFWDGAPGDYFAAKYEGQLMVGAGGTYTFNLTSDDGSMLFIDGVAVIGNDGLHSTSTQSVTLNLGAGAHDIEVRYFENTGDQTLRLTWSGPDTGNVEEVIGGSSYRLPGFMDEDQLGLTENAAGASAAVLSIIDPDADAVTVAVSDERFEVVETDIGHVLKLKDGVAVDHEAGSEISVTVTATDEHGESASESFLIPVADINEAPTGLALSPVAGAGVLVLNAEGGGDAAIATDMEGFPTDALTVEVAFASSQTDVGDGSPLFSYAVSGGSDNEVLLWLEGASGNLNIFLAGQKINTGIPNASLLDGELHQVSVTWDQASNELRVYIDGDSAFATSINIRDLRAGGAVAFGQEQDSEGGGFAANQIFEGEISEVRIFDYARTAGEIAENAGVAISDPETEPGLVNNWVMNSDAGGQIEDLVGVNHLELRNGAHVEGGAGFDAPTVFENQPGAVAGVLSAHDPQTGGDVTSFAIVSDPSGAFEIVGDALKLKDGVSLDHEAQDAYEVTISATGADGATTQQVVTINVANVVEAPVDFVLTPESAPHVLSLNMDGGNNDAAIAANMEGFPTDALTVEVRFTSDQANVGNGAPLFSYAAGNGSDNEALLFFEGASGNLQIYLAGQKIDTGVPNASLLDGAEHQVSFSWDQSSNAVKLYVDGEAAFETAVSIRDLRTGGSLVFGQEQESEGGGYDSGQIFQGEIAEVRIFDYARTDQEIADHAGAPIGDPETEPGLVNNWVMANGTAEDLVGVDHLILQNGASVTSSGFSPIPLVAENDAGAIVGTLNATDPNTGGPVALFAIADDPSGLFEISGNQLKLKDGASLDYETQTSHSLTVAAVASNGEITQMTVAVEVDDIYDPNIINGNNSANTLRGTALADAIYGAGGNDNIDGLGGADELYGGDGNDRIFANSEDTVIDGGAGTDRVTVTDSNAFSIDMAASNVERVDGGGGDDVIDASAMTVAARQYGNGGEDVLTGGSANDQLRGGAGNDRLYGNDGNDTLYGNAGADEIYGGAGNDRIYADSNDTVIDGGAGSDRVTVQGNGDFAIDVAASNVERVDGGGGNDTLDGSGATARVQLFGNDGDDVLTGGSANDQLRGGAGEDVLIGNGGNDNMQGHAGDDVFYGGAGRDNMQGGDGADLFLYEMGDGRDTINGGAGGWTDVIELRDGATQLGDFGSDWTVNLTQGSIVSSDENGLIFSENSDGVITLSDGTTINFTDIEQVAI